MEGLPVDPAENGGDCSYRRLHCEDSAEPGPALRNAFVVLGGLRQWVSLDDGFNFPLRHEIKSFVEIFWAVLLAADDADALHDEIHQRDGKWLRVRAHSDQPAVWPQSLNAIHHGLRRIGSAEDDVGTARCGKVLSVADNFIRAELADQLVFVRRVGNGDGLKARCLCVLHGEVSKTADSEDGHALVRLC